MFFSLERLYIVMYIHIIINLYYNEQRYIVDNQSDSRKPQKYPKRVIVKLPEMVQLSIRTSTTTNAKTTAYSSVLLFCHQYIRAE